MMYTKSERRTTNIFALFNISEKMGYSWPAWYFGRIKPAKLKHYTCEDCGVRVDAKETNRQITAEKKNPVFWLEYWRDIRRGYPQTAC